MSAFGENCPIIKYIPPRARLAQMRISLLSVGKFGLLRASFIFQTSGDRLFVCCFRYGCKIGIEVEALYQLTVRVYAESVDDALSDLGVELILTYREIG